MKVIAVRNVAAALPLGLQWLLDHGTREETRAGTALVSPQPVTTVYERPWERVLLSPVRDANPFFHLVESMWMLAGRDDGAFLDPYIRGFSERFGEAGGRIHGAYGRRWRLHFEGVGGPGFSDQLDAVVAELRSNPSSRQAVLAMWDPVADLGVPGLKDRPCNTHIYLRVRIRRPILDMTVCCRSNDIIMGAYGANAVHLSILQEYLAARIGVGAGTYYQVSNNYHAYTRDIEMLEGRRTLDPSWSWEVHLRDTAYLGDLKYRHQSLVSTPENFDGDLRYLLHAYETLGEGPSEPDVTREVRSLSNLFLGSTLWPVMMAHRAYRAGELPTAQSWVNFIGAPDWRRACREWLQRRGTNR